MGTLRVDPVASGQPPCGTCGCWIGQFLSCLVHTYVNNICQECDELRNPSLHVLECALADRVTRRHLGIELLILYVLPYILLTPDLQDCKRAHGSAVPREIGLPLSLNSRDQNNTILSADDVTGPALKGSRSSMM
jgi:hypothetical protein